jgi:hypothetical protein
MSLRQFSSFLRIVVVLCCIAGPVLAASPTAVVTIRNPIDLARSSETIVLQAAELKTLLGVADIRRVHVRDEQANRELLVQTVDTNDDGTFEELLFQTDIGPNQTRSFRLTVGERQALRPEDFKAYGRFVRERRDDFAWENDRIAHRIYGVALETWAQEPLTSSAVDVWTKRTRRLVINDWYMVDDYHHDNGEGGDFYSAGASRGCGGSGVWADGRLYPSANFRGSRTLANGPIRVMFELTYDAWDAKGIRVSEVKRITLDAGQNFDRFESYYTIAGGTGELKHAIGIKKSADTAKVSSAEAGSLRTWESLKDAGQLGCAIIVDPGNLVDFSEDSRNCLVVTKLPASGPAVYYAGFGWNRSGDFATVEDWDRYIAEYSRRLRAPLKVTIVAAQ